MPIFTLFSTTKANTKPTSIRFSLRNALRPVSWCRIALICCAFTVNASEPTTTVYKKTLPDGSVAYSDQPSQSAESMEVSPVPTVPALETNSTFSRPEKEKKDEAPYTTLAVSSPENQSAFYSGDGSMTIAIAISPKLKRSHLMQYILDGEVVATQKSSALALSRVDRGTHSLQVNIINSAGNIVQSTQSSFTIHRPIVRGNNAP